jgi:hypothetical protein
VTAAAAFPTTTTLRSAASQRPLHEDRRVGSIPTDTKNSTATRRSGQDVLRGLLADLDSLSTAARKASDVEDRRGREGASEAARTAM